MISYDGDKDEEMEEIVENAGTIASCTRGTVPFCRDMGIANYTGKNVINAAAHLESELIDQIEEWEERAVVRSVTFENEDSVLIPKVVIERNVE